MSLITRCRTGQMFLEFFVPKNPKKLTSSEWDESLALTEEAENLESDSVSKRKYDSFCGSYTDIELVDKDSHMVADMRLSKKKVAII